MEHAIHITCKHFVEAVGPTLPWKAQGDDDDEDSDAEFTPGDSLGKALALAKQVSPENYHILQENWRD